MSCEARTQKMGFTDIGFEGPFVDDLIHDCDKTYKDVELRDMEQTMLTVLDFKVSFPTAVQFIRKYPFARKQVEYLALYLVELALLDCTLQYPPEQMAQAAIFIATSVTQTAADRVTDVGAAPFTERALINTIYRLWTLGGGKQKAIKQKYEKLKRCGVAKMEIPSLNSLLESEK